MLLLILGFLTLPFWAVMLDSSTVLSALGLVATCIAGVLVLVTGVPIYFWDRERRTARILYDVDEPALLERLAMCNAAAEWLGHSNRLWHIYYSVATSDWKTNAGASTLIQRTPTQVAPTALPGVELNIGVYSVPFGPQQLLFLPDRLIVRQGKQLAGIPYEQLFVEARATRFIEDYAAPPDTQVVDTTWQYVNKSGSPDRRFNNNRQLPVCRYGEIVLATSTGLRVVLQTSNADAALRASEILSQLRSPTLEPVHGAATAAHHQPERAVRQEERQVPNQPPRPYVPAEPPRSGSPLAVHRAVATLLRFIAVADRKMDDAETEGVVRFLSAFGATDLGEAGDLESQFRALRSDEVTADDAANLLLRESTDLVPHVLNAAQLLAKVDGRVTPKERERLEWMNRKLGSSLVQRH